MNTSEGATLHPAFAYVLGLSVFVVVVLPMLLAIGCLAFRVDIKHTQDDRTTTLSSHRRSREWLWTGYVGPIAGVVASVPVGVASALVVSDPLQSGWMWWLVVGILPFAATLVIASRRAESARSGFTDLPAVRNHLVEIGRHRRTEKSGEESARLRSAVDNLAARHATSVATKNWTALTSGPGGAPRVRSGCVQRQLSVMWRRPRTLWLHWLLLAGHLSLAVLLGAGVLIAALSESVGINGGGFIVAILAWAVIGALGVAASAANFELWSQLNIRRYWLSSAQLAECRVLLTRIARRRNARAIARLRHA